jgi:hypothetical protein
MQLNRRSFLRLSAGAGALSAGLGDANAGANEILLGLEQIAGGLAQLDAQYAASEPMWKEVTDSQQEYARLIVPFRLSYWPRYEFIAEHYWKDKVWLE